MDFWEALDENNKGMWGDIYMPKNRWNILEEDLMEHSLVEKIMTPYITIIMRVGLYLEGDFVMKFDKNIGYTAKSQYLQSVRLTGNKGTNIIGNDVDNLFIGNNVVQFIKNSYGYTIKVTE